MWRIRKKIPYNRRARNFLRTFLLLLLPHPAIRCTPAEIPGPLSWPSVLALPLARALAVFASSHCREQSVRCTARENPIREFCVRSLCTSAFLCGLCLVQASEFELLPLLVGISPCFATITGLRTDPCLYRSLCFSFSCVVLKWRHFSLLFSVKLFLLLPPLRPLPDFLVPRFGGLRAFIADGEGTWC
jgi:hypothetical protein